MDDPELDPPPDARRTFVLVRFVVLRLLGVVYLAAFGGAVREVVPLVGERGLLPAQRLLDGALAVEGSRWAVLRRLPSLFVIMLGAGLIKLRGDPCWVELTCLVHHYETQPNPSYASFLLHAMPRWFHQGGVVVNHVVELLAPIAAFGPRPARVVAGVLFVGFQGLLIVSGNLSFLNWLTIVPALACLDDAALRRVLPRRLVALAEARTTERAPSRPALLASIGWAVVVALLSLQPVANLLSPRQVMNRSYDPLHLVNTYGAFGAVGKGREEIVLEGTDAEVPDERATWREYVLPCKPGPVDRPPCQITPAHLRLDWQAWFLPFGEVQDAPWFVHLVAKLLDGDPTPKRLLAHDPFPSEPPRWLRATRWRYAMVPYGGEPGVWWRRERVGEFMRPVRRGDPELDGYLHDAGLRP